MSNENILWHSISGLTRKQRTQRILNSVRPNSSTKNRTIRGIKTANHIAKGIHYKDCPDVS